LGSKIINPTEREAGIALMFHFLEERNIPEEIVVICNLAKHWS